MTEPLPRIYRDGTHCDADGIEALCRGQPVLNRGGAPVRPRRVRGKLQLRGVFHLARPCTITGPRVEVDAAFIRLDGGKGPEILWAGF